MKDLGECLASRLLKLLDEKCSRHSLNSNYTKITHISLKISHNSFFVNYVFFSTYFKVNRFL